MESGIVLINKPAGLTSFDCLRVLKREWKRTDVGHCGTLDKFATGLLPVMFGDGLKLVRFFLESYPALPTYWKTYRGVILLGRKTLTGDPEGDTLVNQSVDTVVDRSAIERAMAEFVHTPYAQTPPAYSAKKIDGSRASDLARDGKLDPIRLKKADVTLKSFTLHSYERTADEQIRLTFETTCSKGTYVRKLAEDLGEKLGTVGTVLELCRTAVGAFSIEAATPLEELAKMSPDDGILDMTVASSFVPRLLALQADAEALRRGQYAGLSSRLANAGVEPNVYCAALEQNDVPLALLELNADHKVQFLRAFSAN